MRPIRVMPGLCWVLLISRLLSLEGMTAIWRLHRELVCVARYPTLGRLTNRQQPVDDKHSENSPVSTAAAVPACGISQNAHGFRHETCRAHSDLAVVERTTRTIRTLHSRAHVRPAAPARDFRSGSVRSDRCSAFRWAVDWRVVFLLAESNARRSGNAVQDQAERDDHNHGLSDQRALFYLAFLDHDQAKHECSNSPGTEPSHEQLAAPRQTATRQCDRE